MASSSKNSTRVASKGSGARKTQAGPRTSAAKGAGARKQAPAREHPRRDDIVAILLVTLGILLAIAVLLAQRDAAGLLGEYGDNALSVLVGNARYLLPFAFIAWGAIVALRGMYARLPVAGVAAVLVAVIAFFHLTLPIEQMFESALLTNHGGYLGGLLAWPVVKLVGSTGAWVVFAAVTLIGLVLSTGWSISERVREWEEGRKRAEERRKTLLERKRRDEIEAAVDSGDFSGRAKSSGAAVRGVRKGDPDTMPTVISTLPEIIDGNASGMLDVAASRKSSKKGAADDAEATGRELSAAMSTRADSTYKLPPMEMLKNSPPTSDLSETEMKENIALLQKTLAEFEIEATVTKAIKGPTITRYELSLGAGIKVNKVQNLSENLAMALAARDIRILAPIPGRSAIGIEVPNKKRELVCLGDILRSPAASIVTSPLAFAVGKDVAGKPVVADLTAMPHMLVAGATGSGKSVMINAFIISLLMRATPDELRLILIDPKLVELTQYNNLPHLLTPVISNTKRAANALAWVVGQMEIRYEALFSAGVRNIAGYNEWLKKEDPGAAPLPYTVVIVDELADLMHTGKKDVETPIVRLTQKARACGIHVVVATQRPDVSVVTGLIKSNIPTRIVFAVSADVDSRVVLGSNGAEKLTGRGDLLFMTPETLRAERLQGALVTDAEIEEVTGFIKAQGGPQYDPEVIRDSREEAGDDVEVGTDALFEQAVDIVLDTGQASVSYLQRRLSVGYTRAGRLMDILEFKGIVGPNEGAKPREIRITAEEWERMRSTV